MNSDDPFDIEESERQKQSQQKTKSSKPRQKKIIRPNTLIDAFENQSLISPQLISSLVKKYKNPVISFYLNLTPDKLIRTEKVYLTFFNSEKHLELENKKEFIKNLSHSQKQTLENDLNQIEQFLLNYFVPKYTHSIIIFKSGKEFNQIVTTLTSTVDILKIDFDPFLQPLEILIERNPKLLFVHISKEKALYYIYFLGSVDEIETIKSFVPSDNVDASRTAKVQRLRNNMLNDHLKTSALNTRNLCEKNNCDYIILSGEIDTVSKFEQFIDVNLKKKIINKINLPSCFDKKDLLVQLEESISKFKKQKENDELKNLKQYRREGLLVFGLSPVIKAQNQFIIKKIFIDENLSQPGFICPNHHCLDLSPGKCSICQQELLLVSDIVDELIKFSLKHKTEIMIIQQKPKLLKNYGGIAALTHKVYF